MNRITSTAHPHRFGQTQKDNLKKTRRLVTVLGYSGVAKALKIDEREAKQLGITGLTVKYHNEIQQIGVKATQPRS